MGFFDDISDIDPAGGGPKLGVGSYPKLRILDCSVSNGFNGAYFVAEVEVIESSGPDATPPGAKASWTAGIGGKVKFPEIGKGEVKSFVTAAHGRSEDEAKSFVTKERMDAVIAGELNNKIVAAGVWHKVTGSGRAMIKANWTPADQAAAPSPVGAPPPPPAAAQAPASFPPSGWTLHPNAPGYYYKGQEVLSEADLRAKGAAA